MAPEWHHGNSILYRGSGTVATFTKRQRKRGARWTARVRINGREVTKTWPTKAAAETWARTQETAIETGEFVETGRGLIFADLVDAFVQHRQHVKRTLGRPAATFSPA